MKRVWIKRDEMNRIFDLLKELIGDGRKGKYLIPFDKMLPLLEKQKVSRLVWNRASRQAFNSWGLKLGVRNKRRAYLVRIVDPPKWEKAISGLTSIERDKSFPEIQATQPNELIHMDDADPLIPSPDPNYFLPPWSADLLQSINANERIILVGPTGSGKSSLVRELAARSHSQFIRFSCSGETSTSDLIGQWRIQGKEMVFQESVLPQAMRSGAWLCIDEIDAATAPILFCLQMVLEDEGRLLITETGERIIPHSKFRITATANTLGK